MIPTDLPRIIAIGETLWDLFPDAAVWGGAPGNVACHSAALGVAIAMISRVGCDDYGDRGLAALAAYGLQLVAVTRGAAGSLLVGRGQRSERAAEAATIIGTVGAGDAFTAVLIVGLLERRPLEQMHDHAARLAAFVCGQRGATPTIPDHLRHY